MNTLERQPSPIHHQPTLSRNMSSPKLLRGTGIIPNRWESPNASLQGMHELKQQHFYIEKLRVQRERMELLKVEFEKKDAEIQCLTQDLDRMTGIYEDALTFKRRYDQLQLDYHAKQVELQQLSSEFCQCKTQLDVLEVELQRTRNDSHRQAAQLETVTIELENERARSMEQDNRHEHLQRELESLSKRHRNEVDSLKAKWADARVELEHAKKEASRLHEQQEKATRENDQLRQQAKRQEGQLSSQHQRINQLNLQLSKTVSSFSDQRGNEQLAYELCIKDLKDKLGKLEQKCAKLDHHCRKGKSRYKQAEKCLREVQTRSSSDLNRMEFLEQEVRQPVCYRRKQEILIQKYKASERQYVELVERQKAELKQQEQNWRKHQRGPQKLVRAELDRLRHELYLLRNCEVDRIEQVFNSFGLDSPNGRC